MARRKHVSSCPIIEKIVRRLVELGWIHDRGTRHGKVDSPDGKIRLTVPTRPSDIRVSRNWISQIRRQGVPAEVLEGL